MPVFSLPARKSTRLPAYDYSQEGAYFITVCTEHRISLFGAVGADPVSARMFHRVLAETMDEYGCACPKYVLMPNHFHAILLLRRADTGSAPTVSRIIQALKRKTTHEYIQLVRENQAQPFHNRVWQRGFYDHIIRGDEDYLAIWKYIDENPLKWESDPLYIPEDC